MEDINEYMEEFKTHSLKEKKDAAIKQLQALSSLTNTMCTSIGIDNQIFITKDVMEAKDGSASEDDFVEGVVVYLSSIQNSLCDFSDKLTEILDKIE